MDCRDLELSPEKSAERMKRAALVFPAALLKRIIVFVLYLLGAKRGSVASVMGMPQESVKTAVRVILQDGFEAFQDRRRIPPPSHRPLWLPCMFLRGARMSGVLLLSAVMPMK